VRESAYERWCERERSKGERSKGERKREREEKKKITLTHNATRE